MNTIEDHGSYTNCRDYNGTVDSLEQLTACRITRAPDHRCHTSALHHQLENPETYYREVYQPMRREGEEQVESLRPRYRMVHWIIWRCIAGGRRGAGHERENSRSTFLMWALVFTGQLPLQLLAQL